MFDNKMTLPVLILSTTMVLMTAFQMRELMAGHKMMSAGIKQQEEQVQQAAKVKAQFETLSVGTAKLASEGDVSAQAIIGDLKKLGLNVNANPAPGQSPITRIQPQPETAPAGDGTAAPGASAPAAPTTTAPAANAAPAPARVGN